MATQQQISRALDDLYTSTWYEVRRTVADQVFKVTPLYNLLFEKGKIKQRVPDGTHFEIPIRYAALDQNTKWFGRGDLFGTAEKQSLTRLVYDVKNLGTSVVRFWDDDRKNRGKARILSYVDEKLDNTKSALIDKLEVSSFVQDADPKAMNALPTLVSTTPTSGTVGGLARASNSWMANQVKDFTGLGILANLTQEMTKIFNTCSKWKAGSRRAPDIIITTQEIYQLYEEVAKSLQQIVASTSERVSLGFGDLAFKGVELFWAPECEAGKMYFLNSEHLELPYDPGAFMEMTEWKPIAGNSLDKTCQIVTVCNLVVDNFQKQGVIFNIPNTL